MGKTRKDSLKNRETRLKAINAKHPRVRTRQLVDSYEDYLEEEEAELRAEQEILDRENDAIMKEIQTDPIAYDPNWDEDPLDWDDDWYDEDERDFVQEAAYQTFKRLDEEEKKDEETKPRSTD